MPSNYFIYFDEVLMSNLLTLYPISSYELMYLSIILLLLSTCVYLLLKLKKLSMSQEAVWEKTIAEEKLKQHNSDLKVINNVKEIILASNETSNMYIKILLLLGANSDKTNFFSINIFDKYNPQLHIYSLNTNNQSVQNSQHSIPPEAIQEIRKMNLPVIDFTHHTNEANIFRSLHQPVSLYNCAIIIQLRVPISYMGLWVFILKPKMLIRKIML